MRSRPDESQRARLAGFFDDPLRWLRAAAARGPVALVRADGPVLSRDPAATRTVAVFGPAQVRTVLGDMERFAMPVSVSDRHALPDTLANLNSALFSMTGEVHRDRRRLLAPLLGSPHAARHDAAIRAGLDEFLGGWEAGRRISVLHEMRRLARLVAERVLWGSTGPDAPVGHAIQRYFDARRRYAAPSSRRSEEQLNALVAAGVRVDTALREHIAALRQRPGARPHDHVLGALCDHLDGLSSGRSGTIATDLTERELIAHACVLFMSSSEPIATALTWLLLALSQRPGLRAAIRATGDADSPLVHGAVREALRLAPPSAILVRRALVETTVGGQDHPAGCEFIVSPFAEHRDPDGFPDPDAFAPSRWTDASPDPWRFLPFGMGARACLGRHIALRTLELSTVALLRDVEPLLDEPAPLDWRMDVTLLPARDPVFRLEAHGRAPACGARLTGPATFVLPEMF